MFQPEALARHLVPCTIRDYTPEDFEACKAIYASNVPHPFPEEYLQSCLRFLDEGTSYQLVLEHEGRVIGCGGLELRGEGPFAHLLFGSIHRDFQKRGFGSTLLATRLSLIEHEGEVYTIKLETGTDDAAFFAKAGFEVFQVRISGLGPDKDAGILVVQITPDEIETLRDHIAAAGVIVKIVEPEISESFEEAEFED